MERRVANEGTIVSQGTVVLLSGPGRRMLNRKEGSQVDRTDCVFI